MSTRAYLLVLQLLALAGAVSRVAAVTGRGPVRSGQGALGTPNGAAFIEMRVYRTKPESAKEYLSLSEDSGRLRAQLLPFLGAFTVETGAADLNDIYSFYFYNSFDDRDTLRKAASVNQDWALYGASVRPLLTQLGSNIIQVPGPGVPTPAVQDAMATRQARADGLRVSPQPGQQSPAYLLRTYEVPAGVSAKLLASGLPLPTSQAAAGELLIFGTTAMGMPSRGAMVELWRFASAADALAGQGIMAAGGSVRGPDGVSGSSLVAWHTALLTVAPEIAQPLGQAQVAVLRPTKYSNWQ